MKLVAERLEAGGCTVREFPAFESESFRAAERTTAAVWIGQPDSEASELTGKWLAEKWKTTRLKCPMAEAVVSAREADDTGLSAVQKRRLQRGLDGIGARIAQDRFCPGLMPSLECDPADRFAKCGLER